MRVLLINQVFYPDVAATAQHAHDLARHLVRHGHEVTAIASRSLYGQKGAALPPHETVDGVQIHRVGRSIFGKAGILARVADFGLFYVLCAWRAVTLPKQDVVVCFTTPPFIALLGWALRLVRGTRFVYWVMDLYPDLPVACGVMKPRSPLTRFFEGINRFCLRRADRTVVLGRCMLERVRQKDIPGPHVVHIGVWPAQEELAAERPRETNPYRAEWNLGDRFVVMYSGNFGLGHDVDTMLRAAEMLQGDDRFRFVFAGGGKKKEIVDKVVKDRGLKNAVLAPYQPRERLDDSLAVADVHLATLLEGVEGIMVPCKLFGSMGAGRPTIFIGNPTSELSRVLAESDCGLTVRQGDADALVAAIRGLADDPGRCRTMGQNARRAMKDVYSPNAACEQWRTVLEDAVARRPAVEQHPVQQSHPLHN
jgi:colanic acid biosynthesis glycosyl transferase WcaI